MGFRPLSRYIGLYPANQTLNTKEAESVSVPSRGI